MRTQIRIAFISFVFMVVLTGVIYPLSVTGIAQLFFPSQANGSLIVCDGMVRGSELIGQAFDYPRYFWGRLSATIPVPYNANNSSGSNLGPSNPSLQAAAQARIAVLRAVDPQNVLPIPVDLVTASGSGLDPHISLAAAYYQVARVAKERGLSDDDVRNLVEQFTKKPQFGILGEIRVNVLELNMALDGLGKSGITGCSGIK
jgi:K+-transporting ATPase KdpC subunit